jgi:hypothetical protein
MSAIPLPCRSPLIVVPNYSAFIAPAFFSVSPCSTRVIPASLTVPSVNSNSSLASPKGVVSLLLARPPLRAYHCSILSFCYTDIIPPARVVFCSAPKAGSPEELTLAIRLFGSRDIALGLLLRDSASAVVERAVQIGLVSSGLDLAATAFGFVEGNISSEVTCPSSAYLTGNVD